MYFKLRKSENYIVLYINYIEAEAFKVVFDLEVNLFNLNVNVFYNVAVKIRNAIRLFFSL